MALTPAQRVQELVDALSRIHGRVDVRKESSGMHLMMACPKCLAAYGRRELKSRHLQLNVDKLLGTGQHADRFLPGKRDKMKSQGYAQCMKEHGPFSLDEMLGWPTLEERGIDNVAPQMVVHAAGKRYLVPDDKGNMIPDHPGKVIPLTALPYEHPALLYLRQRDYDPVKLYYQFRASWCEVESPEGEQYNRWYRKHGYEWKSTPQGRIIFYSDVCGIQVCWQARYLEIEHEGQKLLWHPYRQRWETRPPWPEKEGPIKYATASGALRNNQLCGFDAVRLALSAKQDGTHKTCVLTEGPLDAARFPERGMALLGKNLSQSQALLLRPFFNKFVLAFDADDAGAEARDKAKALLESMGARVVNFFRDHEYNSGSKVDVGMLGYTACEERLKHLLLELNQ